MLGFISDYEQKAITLNSCMALLTSLIRLSGIADPNSGMRTIELAPEAAPAAGHDQLAPLMDYDASTSK